MFKKLLVPVDGSAPSNAAVELAIDAARAQAAQIVFCHVLDIVPLLALGGSATMDPTAIIESQRELGEQYLASAAERARAAGLDPRTEMVEGEPVQGILELAQRERVDAIVMGSHGRGGIARMVLGSKTEGVLRRAPVPVLVAPTVAPVP
ncbi:universal stress protein [bacterium]|nr:MAG: universal stress protein [bacterium]